MDKTAEFNVETIKSHIYRKWGTFSNIEDQVYSLDDIKEIEAIVYPKNLYKQAAKISDVLLFSFEKEKIRTVTFDEEGSITVVSRLINSIQTIELTHKNRGFSRLTINFKDGEKIEMDSQNDSDHKQWGYQEIIMKLYKEIKW